MGSESRLLVLLPDYLPVSDQIIESPSCICRRSRWQADRFDAVDRILVLHVQIVSCLPVDIDSFTNISSFQYQREISDIVSGA